jgi:hypothetical protein
VAFGSRNAPRLADQFLDAALTSTQASVKFLALRIGESWTNTALPQSYQKILLAAIANVTNARKKRRQAGVQHVCSRAVPALPLATHPPPKSRMVECLYYRSLSQATLLLVVFILKANALTVSA